MEIDFWRYLVPHGGQSALRQPIPEVAIFHGMDLETCFFSDRAGILRHQDNSFMSKKFVLDRYFALAALSAGQHSFSGQSPAAILRHPHTETSAKTSCSRRVLSMSQLRTMFDTLSDSSDCSNRWSLQALVMPKNDTMLIATYSCDSFGSECIDVTSSSFQEMYSLSLEGGFRFRRHGEDVYLNEALLSVLEDDSTEAKSHLLALVHHANAELEHYIKHITVEFVKDRNDRIILHAVSAITLFEAGYPLYPPKTVAGYSSSKTSESLHQVYHLWPSEVPTPTRSRQMTLVDDYCSPQCDDIDADHGKSEDSEVTCNNDSITSCYQTHNAIIEVTKGVAGDALEIRPHMTKPSREKIKHNRFPRNPCAFPPKMPASARDGICIRTPICILSPLCHIDHTPCLPASIMPQALKARAKLQSDSDVKPCRHSSKPHCQAIGEVTAVPAPITRRRAGSKTPLPESREQHARPQDGKSRCVICTLPLPCQHTDEQRDKYVLGVSCPPTVHHSGKEMVHVSCKRDEGAQVTSCCKRSSLPPLKALPSHTCVAVAPGLPGRAHSARVGRKRQSM